MLNIAFFVDFFVGFNQDIFFKKTVSDSNAHVQDKALDALIAYLIAADADAERYDKEVCDANVAKCLTGRPKTVDKAQMVFTLWVELEVMDVFLVRLMLKYCIFEFEG